MSLLRKKTKTLFEADLYTFKILTYIFMCTLTFFVFLALMENTNNIFILLHSLACIEIYVVLYC